MNLSEENILSVNEHNFNEIVLQMFHDQVKHVIPYQEFVKFIGINPEEVNRVEEIPFLPTGLFKSHIIHRNPAQATSFFASSGTTGQTPSKHWHTEEDLSRYKTTVKLGFERFFGSLEGLSILALLPSYAERQNASLVHMVQHWMEESGHQTCGFFLNQLDQLHNQLIENEKAEVKTVLIGVSFALLDFAETFPFPLKNTLLLETGGMKGRREEITRNQLHSILKNAFHCPIYSEYGMTELSSQAYTTGGNRFSLPPWLGAYVQKEDNPLGPKIKTGKGRLCLVDLANVNSCAFISTSDIGHLHEDGTFEVLGRLDYSDIRGCNLMVEL
jgi:phenylacetate-coenzyme A ligase PaaK-like adenylate-forming protein